MIKDDEQKSAITLLREIIVSEMELDSERVIIYNQKWEIPSDDAIFICLSFVGAKTIANRSVETVDGDGNPVESQEVNMQEMIQIDIMSKSTAALFRKWEVIAALVSNHSKQVQEANSFKISVLPTELRDLSDIEGTSRIYRFMVTVILHAWYSKTKAIEYYDAFKLRALTETSDTGEIDQPQPDPEP